MSFAFGSLSKERGRDRKYLAKRASSGDWPHELTDSSPEKDDALTGDA